MGDSAQGPCPRRLDAISQIAFQPMSDGRSTPAQQAAPPAEIGAAHGLGALAIGICTYNRGGRINETLQAAAALRTCGGRLTRVIVIDNASTDDTSSHVRRFIDARADDAIGPRIELWHEPTPGKVYALRRFIHQSHEEFLGVIDDDCLPESGWAVAMLNLLDEHARAGAVGGRVENVWETGPTKIAAVYRRSLGDQLLGDARFRLDDPRSFLMGASMVYRRKALEESGWLTQTRLECRRGAVLECGEDAELCLMIRQARWEIWYEPASRMGHIIPATRQTPAYLARLRESICRSEPVLTWLARGSPRDDAARRWAAAQARRARWLYIKSLLFDYRPTRRRIRVAERLGRARGWRRICDELRDTRPS